MARSSLSPRRLSRHISWASRGLLVRSGGSHYRGAPPAPARTAPGAGQATLVVADPAEPQRGAPRRRPLRGPCPESPAMSRTRQASSSRCGSSPPSAPGIVTAASGSWPEGGLRGRHRDRISVHSVRLGGFRLGNDLECTDLPAPPTSPPALDSRRPPPPAGPRLPPAHPPPCPLPPTPARRPGGRGGAGRRSRRQRCSSGSGRRQGGGGRRDPGRW